MIIVSALNSVKKQHNITDEQIALISSELNTKFSSDDKDIRVSLDISVDGQFEVKCYKFINSDFFKDSHLQDASILSSVSFVDAASKGVEKVMKIDACSHEGAELMTSKEGHLLTNGVAFCKDCEAISREEYLKPIEGNKTIGLRNFGFGDVRYYVTTFNWGKIGVQAGDMGLVIGRKRSRKTAFFEAFPTISGVDTFIRGEGDDVKESEENAIAKYKLQMECDEHDWCRTQNGKERTDGYATCTKCGLRGNALEPTTKCHICSTPTTKRFNDEYICTDHHNLLTFDQLFEESKAYNQGCLGDDDNFLPSMETQEEVDVANYEEMICLTFKVAYRDELLKRGLPFPEKKSEMYDYMFLLAFKENVFGIQSYDKITKLPAHDNKAMAHNLLHIKKKMPEFVDAALAGETKFSHLIIGMLQVGILTENDAPSEVQSEQDA